jgi:acyl carrier protein
MNPAHSVFPVVPYVDPPAGASTDAIERDVRSYIVERFLFGEERPLGAEDSLIASHVIDSTGVLELVSFLEERFAIDVLDREMLPQNLDSLARIAAFVREKTRDRS